MLQKQQICSKMSNFARNFRFPTVWHISSVNVSAFDSETQERMVVYQALYGDRKYWVRPEKMFFEQIEWNGKRFSRFQEIDWEE